MTLEEKRRKRAIEDITEHIDRALKTDLIQLRIEYKWEIKGMLRAYYLSDRITSEEYETLTELAKRIELFAIINE